MLKINLRACKQEPRNRWRLVSKSRGALRTESVLTNSTFGPDNNTLFVDKYSKNVPIFTFFGFVGPTARKQDFTTESKIGLENLTTISWGIFVEVMERTGNWLRAKFARENSRENMSSVASKSLRRRPRVKGCGGIRKLEVVATVSVLYS